jgi:DNA-binding transcriptional MerR regulator
MNQNEQLHSIQQISSKLNIPKPTLRFWEKEFEGILEPMRTQGGQRRYSSKHIVIIEEINTLKKSGLSLAEIKQKLARGQILEIGRQGTGDETTENLDLLAERVAEAVRVEVLSFFHRREE